MKFFIDTANVSEIREMAWLIDGVTTNPSLVAREKRPFEQVIAEICDIVDGPVSAEATALDVEGMIEQGKKLSQIHENVVIKIPMTEEGMKAVIGLSKAGIRTNVTLVFSPNQALVAAKCGASFVSPFVGRIDDVGGDGMELVSQILDIYDEYAFETEVIVASVRHPQHVLD
ncbi:MAG TPA: fructose-6-phosphate aldolase, partial [Candidatus Acetothermia bacterium]|nr:fructose-6-phosphate aldolase [Candidatus Acetothermia bacterium]